MNITTEAEYHAAQEVFRKYRFNPGTTKNHPLQASLDILASAVENYSYLNAGARHAA